MIYEVSFKLCQFFQKGAMVPINNSNQSHVKITHSSKDFFLGIMNRSPDDNRECRLFVRETTSQYAICSVSSSRTTREV